MGDTGSLLCGFIVSILAIQFIEMRAVPASPSVALGVLFVPLFDTLRVSIIRILKGKSPFAPDKNHVHHRLLAMGFSQISTVLILAFINVLVILFAFNFSSWGNVGVLLMLLSFSVVLSVILGVYKSRSPQRVAKAKA
jgi:UDP-N-acetylmuramyl pentapeptide phosphotransferase/UDP-N-acetylglucosamine-1-phosphate transferase